MYIKQNVVMTFFRHSSYVFITFCDRSLTYIIYFCHRWMAL